MESASFGCATCGSTKSKDGTGLKYCNVCKFAMYCCKKHQKEHWKNGHKQECKIIQEKLKKMKLETKNEEEETWESELMKIMKLVKSMQRRFISNEITKKEALKMALKARTQLENFETKLKEKYLPSMPTGCDAKSMTKLILIFSQIDEAFVLTMIYTFELSLLIGNEGKIQKNMYDFMSENRHRKCVLSLTCTNPDCPMNSVWERKMQEAYVIRDCVASLYDGFHGIQIGLWTNAQKVFTDLIQIVQEYEIKHCPILKVENLKKLEHDCGIKSKRKKLQRKLKSDFKIFGTRSAISLETAQILSESIKNNLNDV